jgi:hypothetical protein
MFLCMFYLVAYITTLNIAHDVFCNARPPIVPLDQFQCFVIACMSSNF